MSDALNPSPALLCKLGSIVVHVDEMLSVHGHDYDRIAIKNILSDPDIKLWISEMEKMAMVPVKRNKDTPK